MKLQTEYYVDGNDIVLPDTSCFSLEQTFNCGQAFRFSKHGDVFTGVVNDRVLNLRQTESEIRLFSVTEEEFLQTFAPYFTLDIDYPAIIKSFSQDKTLAHACSIGSGIHLLRQDSFETLCTFILSQNCNIPRIRGMVYRLCEAFGKPLGDNQYTFPTPEVMSKLSVEDLAPVRAGFRAKYLIGAARSVESGKIDFSAIKQMDTESASVHLQQIKGVGAKVAACTLLFGCGRWDSFPVDVWIKRVMEKYYPDGFPKHLQNYAGIAQQYLFFAAQVGDFA